jgi:electron transport complex protein RnfC
MRLFSFRGGIHPDERKGTSGSAIREIPLPPLLYIPLQQHIGAPAQPIVKVGQHVLKGELIAEPDGMISAPVHASSSGEVVAIAEQTAPHPSGLPVRCIVIATDGKDEWAPTPESSQDPSMHEEPEAIARRVAQAGIVGMGGAAFPSAVKLSLGQQRHVGTLIINGGECEPYLTCDDRLMQERAEQICHGIRLMLTAIGGDRALVAIESNKPRALKAMREAGEACAGVEVVSVPTRYPMGSEKQMIQALTGKEIPAGGRSADIGVVVHNVATAYAVQEAVELGRPLVSRIVTVSGSQVEHPGNLEVPIGTPASHLVEHSGGLISKPARLVLGGPMMGITIPHLDVPIVKGTNGLLALSQDEIEARTPGPCIRCGRCVQACPVGLVPLQMAAHTRAGDIGGAADRGLADCISCGSCSFVCPASIPLTQYFNFGKGELAARAQAKKKADHTRELAEARQARLERQKAAKAAAAAKRKAERAAKQAAKETEKA